MARMLITRLLPLFVLTALALPPVSVYADGPINVMADDKLVAFDAKPFIENGRVLVPVRRIAEALGLDARWNPESNQADITGAGKHIILTIGSAAASVDGNAVNLGAPARIVSGRTFAPLRFIGEAAGADVTWDSAARIVWVTRPVFRGMEADTKFSFLWDRLFINAPAGFEYDAGSGTITYTSCGQTMQIMATETNNTCSGDLVSDAKTKYWNFDYSMDTNYDFSGVIDAPGIQYVTVTPKQISASIDANDAESTVLNALVETADNTLIDVRIYVNRAALLEKDDITALARKIVGSIQGGTKLLDTKARTVRLAGLKMDVPDGWASNSYYNADSVCIGSFNRLANIGKNTPSFGISVYPEAYWERSGMSSDNTYADYQKADSILGRNVVWNVCNIPGQDKSAFKVADMSMDFNYGSSHIWINARVYAQNDLDQIEQMLHSLAADDLRKSED